MTDKEYKKAIAENQLRGNAMAYLWEKNIGSPEWEEEPELTPEEIKEYDELNEAYEKAEEEPHRRERLKTLKAILEADITLKRLAEREAVFDDNALNEEEAENLTKARESIEAIIQSYIWRHHKEL